MKTEEFVKKYDVATKYPTEVWFFNKMAPKDMSAVWGFLHSCWGVVDFTYRMLILECVAPDVAKKVQANFDAVDSLDAGVVEMLKEIQKDCRSSHLYSHLWTSTGRLKACILDAVDNPFSVPGELPEKSKLHEMTKREFVSVYNVQDEDVCLYDWIVKECESNLMGGVWEDLVTLEDKEAVSLRLDARIHILQWVAPDELIRLKPTFKLAVNAGKACDALISAVADSGDTIQLGNDWIDLADEYKARILDGIPNPFRRRSSDDDQRVH